MLQMTDACNFNERCLFFFFSSSVGQAGSLKWSINPSGGEEEIAMLTNLCLKNELHFSNRVAFNSLSLGIKY